MTSFEKFIMDIPSGTLWIAFAVFVAAIGLLSIILLYHWNKYRLHSPATARAGGAYVIGVAVLVLLSAAALLWHTF